VGSKNPTNKHGGESQENFLGRNIKTRLGRKDPVSHYNKKKNRTCHNKKEGGKGIQLQKNVTKKVVGIEAKKRVGKQGDKEMKKR